MSRPRGIAIATIALEVILAVAFVLQAAGVLDPVALSLASNWVNPGRFLLHPFLHANILHLLVDLAFLLYLGWVVERDYGNALFLLVFFFSTYFGALLWVMLTGPHTAPFIGLTASITALVAINAIFKKWHPVAVGLGAFWLIIQILLATMADFSTTGWPMMLSGVLTGTATWLLVVYEILTLPDPPEPRRTDEENERLAVRSAKVPRRQQKRTTTNPFLEAHNGLRKRRADTGSGLEMAGGDDARRIQGIDEKELLRVLDASPDDLDAQRQLLDLYIAKGNRSEAMALGRRVVPPLCEKNQVSVAYDYYSRMVQRFGAAEVGPRYMSLFVEDRLEVVELEAASDALEVLFRLDPTYRTLPDYITRLAELLMRHRGPRDEETEYWVKTAIDNYPNHPSTKKMKKAMQIQTAEMGVIELREEAEEGEPQRPADRVLELILDQQVKKAADLLLDDDALIAEIDPLVLFRLVGPLSENEDTVTQAIMLLEKTVRAHEETSSTPGLIVELIELYTEKVDLPERARQWRDYILQRWPESDAAEQVKNLII